MLKKFLQDAKERYLNWNTIRGVIYISGGLMLLLFPKFTQTILIIALLLEGAYQLFENPIKKEFKKWELIAQKDFNNLFNFNKQPTKPEAVSDNAIPNPDK